MESRLKDPDFLIAGLQKSGTWWLSALLDTHPEIRCLPNHVNHSISKGKTGADEGRIFDMLATVDKDGGAALSNSFLFHHGGFFKDIVPMIGKVNKEELEKAVIKKYREWFVFHNPENKPIVGDKTVEYVFHLDAIDKHFPRVKKICVTRNPDDRVVSWHHHQIRKGRKDPSEKISSKFRSDYINDQVLKEQEVIIEYEGYIHFLKYEDLVKDPVRVLSKLLEYLGAKNRTEKIIKSMVEACTVEKLCEAALCSESRDFYRK